MSEVKRVKTIDKKLYFFCFMPVIFLFLSMLTGCATMEERKYDSIRAISFSPDGKKILFDRTKNGNPYILHVYDLESGELSAFQSPLGEYWAMARYSFDGKHIVFIIMPHVGQQEDLANAQIAVMDADGKNVKKITNTTGFKLSPSFSHSGRKIIFARADAIRKSGSRMPAANYDAYESDVETGRETRLTQFSFYQMSGPYYFPDDKTFIFWAQYPARYPEIPPTDHAAMDKICKSLRSKYKYNEIYVMHGDEKELKPYIVFSKNSLAPTLNADGSVLIFAAEAFKPDGSADRLQLFQYSSDGNHRRITHIPALIESIAVSNKGDQVAVVYDAAFSERGINNIVIYQVKDGSSKEITLLDQPSRIINGQ